MLTHPFYPVWVRTRRRCGSAHVTVSQLARLRRSGATPPDIPVPDVDVEGLQQTRQLGRDDDRAMAATGAPMATVA